MDEKYIEQINKIADSHADWIKRGRSINIEEQLNLLKKWQQVFIGKATLDDSLISSLKRNDSYELIRYLEEVLFFNLHNKDISIKNPWTIENPVIQKLIQYSPMESGNNIYHFIARFVARKLTSDPDTDINSFIQFLHKRNFTDQIIISQVLDHSGGAIFCGQRSSKNQGSEQLLTKFGEYTLKQIQPQKNFFGLKKDSSYKEYIDKYLTEIGFNTGDKTYNWVTFLYSFYPEGLNNCEHKYLYYREYNQTVRINFDCLYLFIEKDASKLEDLIIKTISKLGDRGQKFSAYLALSKKLNGKYHENVIEIGENYYTSAFTKHTTGHVYYYDTSTRNGYLSIDYANYLLQHNKETGKARIEKFLVQSDFIYPHFLKFLDEQFGADSVLYLVDALFKETDKSDYYTTIFTILKKYDFRPHVERILEFAIQIANAKTRGQVAALMTKYPDEILPIASSLVTEKTVNQRITGALILSEINTEQANTILNEAVDQEINDDTRDIMLEALSSKRFAKPYSLEMVKDMVAQAENRKKLSRWNEKWIIEEKLPKLYWKDGKKELSAIDIRFLLYRMKRAQGLNSDIEAKQMLNHIDKDTSDKFAKAMLLAFQDSNSDTKLKYYLTIAGLLGDDDMMYNLNVLFKKNIAEKRVKMAEYVIGALAMVGSNKALRSVEVIYRKFINKKPAISAAAKEALTAAANELSISMDELADRIIPNFDFDGLYRRFEVDGEEYRAFISSDFSLNYLNDDNKIRKSAPANTPKELKTEFKEIEKEIRDIVKSQSDRLEKYMLEERRWPATDWQNFFFLNPIMFVYALKLVWGVFDKNNTLINTFYCSEDTSLYNINDEEVIIGDDQYIGIIHPIYLSSNDLKLWHDKVYSMQLTTIFPVFERPIFTIDESEKEQNLTKHFFGTKVPKGADFVNTFLVKKNWRKSTGDGGSSEFTKFYKDEIKAYANIEGPAAFYQGGDTPATVYEISFIGKSWSDKVLLKNLPALFYSEVMSDINQLLKAE